jgi:hypothetical protein
MRNSAQIRVVKKDVTMGPFSWQRTATERRPLPDSWVSDSGRVSGLRYEACLRLKGAALRLQIMRRMFNIIVAFLAMLWIASPALACLLPARAMTAAEHACCKQMAKMCGFSNMPQSHSCCQKEAQPSNTSVVVAHHQSAFAPQIVTELVAPFTLLKLRLLGATLDRPPSASPPDSIVLRV